MNNKNIDNYSSDPDARYRAKGKNDIWLGYKRHVGVDMHQGLVSKVAVTPANTHDGAALKHVRPSQGAVVADKIYSDGKAKAEMKSRGLHSMAIKKNNAKDKILFFCRHKRFKLHHTNLFIGDCFAITWQKATGARFLDSLRESHVVSRHAHSVTDPVDGVNETLDGRIHFFSPSQKRMSKLRD